MKRTKYLILLILLAISSVKDLSGQMYFQQVYGQSSFQDFGYDGNVLSGLGGWLITGASTGTVGGVFRRFSSVAYTRPIGGNPFTQFANYYLVYDVNNVVQKALYTFGDEVNTTDIGIAGSSAPLFVGKHVFYAQLSSSGTVIASQGYSIGSNFEDYTVQDFITEPTGDYAYIVGEVRQISPQKYYFYVMKIQTNGGALVWSKVYELETGSNKRDWAKDGRELPNGTEFVLVGSTFDNNDAEYKGFVMLLESSTGNPVPSTDMIYLEEPGGSFSASSVDLTTEPTLNSNLGYIIAGSSSLYPAAFLLDYDFNSPQFISNRVYTLNTNSDSYIYDVQTRTDAGGTLEYWMGGFSLGAYRYGGASDIEVWRLDDGLSPKAPYYLTFGDSGFDEARAIDIGSGLNGLTIFGTTDAPNGDNELLIVQSYYSGHLPTGCNIDYLSVSDNDNLDITTDTPPSPLALSFVEDDCYVLFQSTMDDDFLCYSTSVTGGDNSKNLIQNDNQIADETQLFGNPSDGFTLSILNSSDKGKTAIVSLTDISGKVILSESFHMRSGQNWIDLRNLENSCSSGLYLLRLTYDGKSDVKKIYF